MDTFGEIIGRVEVGLYLSRSRFALKKDLYLFKSTCISRLETKSNFDSTTFLIANVNRCHRNSSPIDKIIDKMRPMFV